MPRTLAVVGNGPAALYLSVLMANKGWRVRLFDPKSSMEMKRGGAIVVSALAEFPRFETYGDFREIDFLRIHSPKGRARLLEFREPLRLASRDQIVGYLSRLAIESGVEIYPAKIEGVARKNGTWHVQTALQEEEADFVVGADGAAGLARKVLGVQAVDDEMTLEIGYDLPMPLESGRVGLIQFMQDLPGALWALPSSQGGTNLRLWATSRLVHARNLFERADGLIKNLFETSPPMEACRQASHVPIYRHGKKIRTLGEGWALIAEAAGFVNPLSQDGLYFGLKSAALLALSFSEKDLDAHLFQKRIKLQVFKPLNRLVRRARWWKSPLVLDWTIGQAQKSPRALRALLGLLDPRN